MKNTLILLEKHPKLYPKPSLCSSQMKSGQLIGSIVLVKVIFARFENDELN